MTKRGPKGIDWDAQPLGDVTDREIAERLGVTATAVTYARIKRGIPAYAQRTSPLGIEWDAEPLGQEPDGTIAERLGVHVATVRYARTTRGIVSHWAIEATRAAHSRATTAAQERDAAMLRLHEDGLTVQQIAGYLDVSTDDVEGFIAAARRAM